MKPISEDDLIRKPLTRIIVWGLSLFMIVISSQHIAHNGITWEAVVVALFGVGISGLLINSYEDLLLEAKA